MNESNQPPPEPPIPPPLEPRSGGGRTALNVTLGFIAAPVCVYLVALVRAPGLGGLLSMVFFAMLFFRQTRAFALGALLAVGVALLAVLAICGGMIR